MLKEFGHEIWTADGPDVALVGFRSPTSCRLGLVGDFNAQHHRAFAIARDPSLSPLQPEDRCEVRLDGDACNGKHRT